MATAVWDVLKAPVITEKALKQGEKSVVPQKDSKNKKLIKRDNQLLTFRVATNASKHAIKAAVEHIFKVKVKQVRTVNYHGHQVRRGRTVGYKPDWKKAYVTLASGHLINYEDFI